MMTTVQVLRVGEALQYVPLGPDESLMYPIPYCGVGEELDWTSHACVEVQCPAL